MRGHSGTVKCIQVEDHVCLTGGEDGNVRLWDLRRVDDEDGEWTEGDIASLSEIAEEDEDGNSRDDGFFVERSNNARSSKESEPDRNDPCARLLEGHSKAVTALYFEDECLVRLFPPDRSCNYLIRGHLR